MDDKRELNDILIGGDEYRTRQSKKLILLIVGIVVLVLAIVIIAISIMNSKNDDTIVVGETVNVNPPADTQITPIESDDAEEDNFARIVRDIKAKQKDAESQAPQTMPATPVSPINEPKVTMPERKPAAPKPTVTTTTPTPRVQQPARSVYRGNNGDIAENGYYLQVGAFSKLPNKDFLDRINKYSYRIQEIMINSKVITRYLIGPYASRAAAERDYNNIVRDIATPVYLQVE